MGTEYVIAECPRCYRWSNWTDGTDTEFWCQVCGVESKLIARHPVVVDQAGGVTVVVLELSEKKEDR